MLVIRTNPKTGETVTQSIAVSKEQLNEIRIDIIAETTKVIERGSLSHLSLREVKFLYLGILDPLEGTPEQKYQQLISKE